MSGFSLSEISLNICKYSNAKSQEVLGENDGGVFYRHPGVRYRRFQALKVVLDAAYLSRCINYLRLAIRLDAFAFCRHGRVLKSTF